MVREILSFQCTCKCLSLTCIYSISQNPVNCKHFLINFFNKILQKPIDKHIKMCYCNRGSPSPIYIMVLLYCFNVLKSASDSVRTGYNTNIPVKRQNRF